MSEQLSVVEPGAEVLAKKESKSTFERVTYSMILEAVQPIAHHSETFGNTAIVMTEPIRQPDGRKTLVPIITGDAMRHGLREAGAYVFLETLRLLDEPALSEAALRLLFSGGIINGASGSTISIENYRKMVDLVPALGLFGGCAGNRMFPGRVQVDRALLICEESARLLRYDPWLRERIDAMQLLPRARSAIELEQRVRMDPTLHAVHRTLLSPAALAAVDQRMLASEAASESGDAVAIRDSKSTMMPRTCEVVVPGSLFAWSVTVTLRNPLDRDTFEITLAAWLSNMVVGGKRGTGHGRLAVVEGNRMTVGRPSEVEAVSLPDHQRVGELFRSHILGRMDAIKDFLAKVEA